MQWFRFPTSSIVFPACSRDPAEREIFKSLLCYLVHKTAGKSKQFLFLEASPRNAPKQRRGRGVKSTTPSRRVRFTFPASSKTPATRLSLAEPYPAACRRISNGSGDTNAFPPKDMELTSLSCSPTHPRTERIPPVARTASSALLS
jgi:hypothetical protein